MGWIRLLVRRGRGLSDRLDSSLTATRAPSEKEKKDRVWSNGAWFELGAPT